MPEFELAENDINGMLSEFLQFHPDFNLNDFSDESLNFILSYFYKRGVNDMKAEVLKIIKDLESN